MAAGRRQPLQHHPAAGLIGSMALLGGGVGPLCKLPGLSQLPLPKADVAARGVAEELKARERPSGVNPVTQGR